MKKVNFIFMFLLCLPTVMQAQQITIDEAFANNDTLPQVSNFKEKKLAYSFINEYGLSFGAFFDNGGTSLGITGVFINSICFNKKQDMIGIGVGCDVLHIFMWPSLPIFVNYRHYFPNKTNVEPLINVALGTRISIGGEAGIYSTVSGGFRYKALSVTLGFFIKSWNEVNYCGGAEIKIGYTFFK